MCGGGSKNKTPVEPQARYTPDPRRVADTSNDYSARRGAVIASTGEQTTQPNTFGAELGSGG